MGKSVMQEWACDLTFMQQSVLITATRGPDGIRKDHIAKVLLRWFRRCFLYSAFEKKIFIDPYEPGGGSFTGPCETDFSGDLSETVDKYLNTIDELPHHFQLHFMHAAEILGYKHPNKEIRQWWFNFYFKIVEDAHLNIETEKELDYRLGDIREQWAEKEFTTKMKKEKNETYK
jgi:hypothetical protein